MKKKSSIKNKLLIADEKISGKIYLIRAKRVMLDRDLAEMFGVTTSRLNEQVRRNIKRFPEDFMFQLTRKELDNWISQIATSNREKMGLRKLPLVFTEQGVAMLASVLNSETAIDVNIQIVRVFTRMREYLLTHGEILLKLEKIEKELLKHDHNWRKHEDEIQKIFNVLKHLLNPPNPPRKRIGFELKKND